MCVCSAAVEGAECAVEGCSLTFKITATLWHERTEAHGRAQSKRKEHKDAAPLNDRPCDWQVQLWLSKATPTLALCVPTHYPTCPHSRPSRGEACFAGRPTTGHPASHQGAGQVRPPRSPHRCWRQTCRRQANHPTCCPQSPPAHQMTRWQPSHSRHPPRSATQKLTLQTAHR
jgi:hypothetical protein